MAGNKNSGRTREQRAQALVASELAQPHAARAMERVVELVESGDEQVAIAAAKVILERAYGKPVQPIEGSGSWSASSLQQMLAHLPEALAVLGAGKP